MQELNLLHQINKDNIKGFFYGKLKGVIMEIRFKSFSNISTYKFEKLIELIQKFNSMSDSDKEIFKIILENENKSK